MSTDDPIRELVHDHSELNRHVLELGAIISGRRPEREAELLELLAALREHLFLHFAREEEGLFPFVSEQLPELADQVNAMAVAHDAICGSISRMVYLASTKAKVATLRPLFERFEAAYVAHSKSESLLLRNLDGHFDAGERTRLAALVRGL